MTTADTATAEATTAAGATEPVAADSANDAQEEG
jgi:hypothetical protein